jgi:hypothetical protein
MPAWLIWALQIAQALPSIIKVIKDIIDNAKNDPDEAVTPKVVAKRVSDSLKGAKS